MGLVSRKFLEKYQEVNNFLFTAILNIGAGLGHILNVEKG